MVKLVKNQVKLLMIVDGDEGHYTVIKNISRLLSKLNGKTQHASHYCMNCLNSFCTDSARDKHYRYCNSNGHVKVNVSTKKEKCLKFHDEQSKFKIPLMVYADFESTLKPFDEGYKDKMNTMKTQGKGKAPQTENMKPHVPSGYCVHSTFAYGDSLIH